MDKGYIENGFIVDVSNANKTSEIIYELSRILDLPDAQSKKVCLKLGNADLSTTELTSIKALVESMNSEIEFITTGSNVTAKSAEEMEIEVSVLENKVPTPEFDADREKINKELEKALDKIFGDDNSEIKTFAQEKELKEYKEEVKSDKVDKSVTDSNIGEISKEQQIDTDNSPLTTHFSLNETNNSQNLDDFNSELSDANKIEGEDIKEIDFNLDDLRKRLRETEKLPTLYIQGL